MSVKKSFSIASIFFYITYITYITMNSAKAFDLKTFQEQRKSLASNKEEVIGYAKKYYSDSDDESAELKPNELWAGIEKFGHARVLVQKK